MTSINAKADSRHNLLIENEGQRGAYAAAAPRPRGLWGQFWMLVLQPAAFFRTLPWMHESRHWFWMMILILALVAFAAVRHADLAAQGAGGASEVPVPQMFSDPTMGGAVSGGMSGLPPDMGGMPPVNGGGTASTVDVTRNWVTGLRAAANVVLGWFVLTILLIEAPMMNGVSPRLGRNFQIAVWASVPLGLMAALQLLFFAAGGELGKAGISGLLEGWDFYENSSPLLQSLLLSLTSQFTLFGLWSLLLVYKGARYALNGRRWVALMIVIFWVAVLVVVPAVTGAYDPAEVETEAGAPTEIMPGGEFEGMPGEPLPEGVEIEPDGLNVRPSEMGAEAEVESEAAPAVESEAAPPIEPTESQTNP